MLLESRLFPQTPLLNEQYTHSNLSLALQPEFYYEWADGYASIVFVPYLRIDQHDGKRTHFDVRELFWQKVSKIWELRFGIRKVFWGVTESRHLVDIINQTDYVENLDGEEKLGQLMLNLALIRSWGTIDFYILPLFRERPFPGWRARPRYPIMIETDRAMFESSSKKRLVDFAVRWFHTVGVFDVGLAYFYGTSREPFLTLSLDDSGQPILIPFYDVIHQTSLDLQATIAGWLIKLEALTRRGLGDRFLAFTSGLEYTFANAFGSGADLGFLGEYIYDRRDKKAFTPFRDEIFLGMRLALNDIQGTNLLTGVMIDRDSGTSLVNVEGSRRIGSGWKLNLEVRGFIGAPESDLLYVFRKDDYLQIELSYHF
ncbi:hypothetical protein GWO43_09410 [candidate division KSB1 bacterium]|nr:hypothetical protein [candidate division KSB1 bacterium]NIR69366.1 hypothetical protein [candidate division KSB1 bacterium]NIS24184.1 hypothetical protein [candidate division KSB1 bacterium]NIT71099.1 hypothetical protein [candidate division KSB1 bacterium]NIU24803.1 hypothetical protein [candidate division KSB1 bacterium]